LAAFFIANQASMLRLRQMSIFGDNADMTLASCNVR
jgi:hypothetical protein